MEHKTVLMTPAIAREYLKRNVSNRPIRPTVVEGLKDIFERGEYVQTHQGVAFDVTGNLIDGQHRLSAIAMMPEEFCVPILVTRGLPEEAYRVTDIGLKRSNADVLHIQQGLAAVARYMARMVERHASSISPTLLLDYTKPCEREYQRLMDYCPTITKTWSSAAIRTAAILRMKSGGDEDYILLSYHAINHADYDSMSRIVKALYRQQTQGRVRGISDLFLRAFRAFDVKRANLDTIQITDPSLVYTEAKDVIVSKVLGKKVGVQKPAPKVEKKKIPYGVD